MAELVDAPHLKCVLRMEVRVQVPLVPSKSPQSPLDSLTCSKCKKLQVNCKYKTPEPLRRKGLHGLKIRYKGIHGPVEQVVNRVSRVLSVDLRPCSG